MGLKPADIRAAFGFNKAILAALPSVKEVLATIRRSAHAGRHISHVKVLRTLSRVRGIHENALWRVRTRGSAQNNGRTNGLFLLALLGLSRILEHNQLRPVRGEGGGIKPHRLKDFNPISIAGAPRLRATGASDVQYKAWGVFRSMIAAGASPEQAQKAVEAVYLEEDQRLAAEQRYIDSLQQGGKAQGGGQPPRDSPMRNGRLL